MTKAELIKEVKAVIEGTCGVKVTNAMTQEVVEKVTTAIAERVVEGEKVVLPNIGKLSTKVRKGRSGTINFGPRAGERYQTEDKLVVTISGDTKLTEKLNEG
jgi:nucleoid DNA-binding protein